MWTTKRLQLLSVLSLVGSVALGSSAFLDQGHATQPASAQGKPADGQGEALAVIDRAIKAHGGEANQRKYKAVSFKWEGKRKVEGFYWDSVNVVSYQMPDRVRIDSELQNPNGGTISIFRIVDGKKGWIGSATRSRELKDTEVAPILDETYAHWLASLVPLKDKEFTFSLVGQTTVDDKEAIGITASRKSRPDVNLYFDKKTGLLVKSEWRTKDFTTGQEYTAESTFRDHKAFHGVMWATKRLDKRDGMDLEGDSGRLELSDYRAHDTLDAKLFAKP